MGVYDAYEGIQLKVGEVCLNDYSIGDNVCIPDGVYIAPDGAVVIKDGKLLMTTDNVQDKWGGVIDVEDKNPVHDAARNILIDQLQAENEQFTKFIKWGEREEIYKIWTREQALKDQT